jgi:hypothetical protein
MFMMGDARSMGGREQGRAARTESARAYYDEQWLEHMVSDLYHAVVNEPVPSGLLDIAKRIPDPSASEARARARRWRAKAEELRTAAQSASGDTAWRALLLMARDYDALAEHAEHEARQQDERGRDVG